MNRSRYLPPLFRGQVREFRLRKLASRTRNDVRTAFARGTSLIERVLQYHASKEGDGLPSDWEKRVRRNQIQGDGQSVPELVSYEYDGEEVLAVWTYVENNVLHILVRRSKAPVLPVLQPYGSIGWSLVPGPRSRTLA